MSIKGFLEATVEYALRREDLREGFLQYLVEIVEKEAKNAVINDVGKQILYL